MKRVFRFELRIEGDYIAPRPGVAGMRLVFATHMQSPQLWTDRGARHFLSGLKDARAVRRKQLNSRCFPCISKHVRFSGTGFAP
jgi:hypothetical protein